MARSLAMPVFALGLSARAQDAQPSKDAGTVEPTERRPMAGRTEAPIVLAEARETLKKLDIDVLGEATLAVDSPNVIPHD